MDQPSPVISQHVFGSSKKIQFISIPTHDGRRTVRGTSDAPERASTVQQTMSIESLLDSNGDSRSTKHTARISELLADSEHDSPKRRWESDGTERSAKQRRFTKEKTSYPTGIQQDNMTTITCLHASVAQKSYGTEKRFLCPPPLVMMRGPHPTGRPHVSMTVVGENGDLSAEQSGLLDDQLNTSFKYLHVSGTAKAKQFCLRVGLSSSNSPIGTAEEADRKPYATFLSNPIAIISKPSKKTSKARNVSTCILANAPISLFNRINSQTVRTKYMTSEGNRLCAKNSTWSPFDIIITHNPSQPVLHTNRPALPTSSPPPVPLHYSTEIILKDTRTGVTSPPLIIRKVDRGRITPCAYGPVSQMQKIALQLASTVKGQPAYLSAAGSLTEASSDRHDSGNATTWLDISRSRITHPVKPSLELAYEEVDDYLCWTIVGITKFECTFFKENIPSEMASPPPSPPASTHFPILSSVLYRPTTHTLDVIGQHLLQTPNSSQLIACYLGNHGPLNAQLVSTQSEQPGSLRQSHHITIELPKTQDLLITEHDRLVQRQYGRRCLELPLLFSRKDGLVYHSGKMMVCDILANGDTTLWSVVSVSHNPL